MRPLDRLPSIKLKLGIIIVATVAGTTVAVLLGIRAGLGWFVSFVLAAALGLASIQVLARGMTSPLREMVRATHAMARGDYSRRITASSKDEVGELARAFNQMAGQLAEVDRVRRDLVANVSHELRTPIAALQATLENALDGITEADSKTLTAMLAQVQRLSRLVDQLLELSKLESGVIPLEIAEFPVKRLFDRVVEQSKFLATATHRDNVRIDVNVDPPDLVARADEERIRQVVANLVENAIRHSPRGANVSLRATGTRDELHLEIVDQGPGIEESEREKVFERFYRSDASRSADGGAGLGLSIARWVVDLHGGRISAAPNDPTGSRFSVVLPGAPR
ncbi:MAG: ATP-binding protein [Actinomycetota bacterium]|nr:ATP-binding protein [Actinomycetota bacterium]